MRLPGFSLLHSSLHFRDLWQLLQRKPVRYANRREGRKHTRNTLSNFVCLFAGTCSSLSVIVASRYSDHPSRITASSPKSTTTGVIDPGSRTWLRFLVNRHGFLEEFIGIPVTHTRFTIVDGFLSKLRLTGKGDTSL